MLEYNRCCVQVFGRSVHGAGAHVALRVDLERRRRAATVLAYRPPAPTTDAYLTALC